MSIIVFLSLLLIGLGIGGMVYILASIPLLERPDLGLRGVKRLQALEDNMIFRNTEFVMRWIGAWVQRFELPSLRRSIQKKITHAGEYQGLSPDEVISLSILYGFLFLFVGVVIQYVANVSFIITLALFGIGSHVAILGAYFSS